MIERRLHNDFLPGTRRIFHFVSLAVILCCLASCHYGGNKKINQTEAKAVLPPDTVIVERAAPIFLDSRPKPQTVIIPDKPAKYTIRTARGDTTIPLLPPRVKPAGFYSLMQNYTTDNGLALDAISCSCSDHFGNLWFGTQGGGVSRYDGKSFTNFTATQGLSNDGILSMLEDKSGNMWFGTDGGGICRYDGRSFTSYTKAQGLGTNSVWSMLQDKNGNMWFGTVGGVSRYDGKTFKKYTKADGLCNNSVYSMIEDRKGNLWFGTNGGGVSCYNGKTFTNYTTEQGLANNYVFSICEDKKGNLWFCTHEGGVSCYNGKTFTNYTTEQGLSSNNVYGSIVDKSGNLWFCTDGGGVSCYDGKTFTGYTTEQGLSNNSVFSVTADKAGNLWFSTGGGGISRYDGKSFTSYTTAQGLSSNSIFGIMEDKKGNIWFGTQAGGVDKYDGKTYTGYTTAQGMGNDNVYSMTEDRKGNLWFGTDGGGVSRFDGKSITTYTTAQGLAYNSVFSIIEDKKGDMWFGTHGGGVSRFNGKSFTNYTTTQGLNDVFTILEDKKGNLWFGTEDGGAICYDGKSFMDYTTDQGLGSNTVATITEDESGNLWLGTQGGGVSRYDGKTFTTYTTAQGLSDNGIGGIVLDKQGNIVIGTNFGIAVLKSFVPKSGDKAGENLPAQNNKSNAELENYTPVFKIFNSKTGYPVKDVNGGSNNGSMLCDSKGNIWAGTGSEKTSLVKFAPAAVNRNPDPPTVLLQNVKINEENICWYTLALPHSSNEKDASQDDSTINAQQEIMAYGKLLTAEESDTLRKKFGDIQFDGIGRFYPVPENLVLPFQDNHITFEFAAIEPAKPYLVKYQYILEGYDKEWSHVTAKNNPTFGNIYEGTYTFKVRAQSPDGIWSEPVTYTFKVLPPLYRTWWAYSLYAIFAFLLLFGLYRWRTASLHREKEVLEETVKQRTMEVVKEKDEAEKHRTEAEKQKNLVEEKNKDITDSINYAKRIQRALLKEEEYVSYHLPEHFILFKPKDIVSGDFYWAIEKEDYLYLAAVDCTGHGVPGGFMSMLGLAFLNELTSGAAILTPAEILDKLREKILKEFRQKGGENETKDGMDISLMRVNLKTREVQWSGANSPVYIAGKELKEITPDKQPIGYYPLMKPFTNHIINAEKGSVIYLFSDGYADQFGGPKGKKFKHSQLKEVVFSVHDESMKEQKKRMNEIFEKWKGNLEQVDDVLIIGMRV